MKFVVSLHATEADAHMRLGQPRMTRQTGSLSGGLITQPDQHIISFSSFRDSSLLLSHSADLLSTMGSTTTPDVPLGSRLISINGLRKSWESDYDYFDFKDKSHRPTVHMVMNEDEPLSNIWQKIEGYWPEHLLVKDHVNN